MARATAKRVAAPVLELRGVSKRYGRALVLDKIDLSLAEHEVVCLIGASGSGKSTLLRCADLLEPIDAGSITLDGRAVSADDRDADATRRQLGIVFQGFSLFPHLTALENVMLPIELKGDAQARAKATALLERVGLAERITHYPNQLSGGEQQRVAIARAFATEAKILFADEPTGNLDTATGAKIVELIFDLNKEFSTTLVLVTHDERLAQRCGRIVRLIAGEIESDSGSPQGAASNNANASESTESASA